MHSLFKNTRLHAALFVSTTALILSSPLRADVPTVRFSGANGTFNTHDPIRLRAFVTLSEKSDKLIEVPFEVHWQGMTPEQSGFDYRSKAPLRFEPGETQNHILVEAHFKSEDGPDNIIYELKEPVNAKLSSTPERRSYVFGVADFRRDYFGAKNTGNRAPSSIDFSFEKGK